MKFFNIILTSVASLLAGQAIATPAELERRATAISHVSVFNPPSTYRSPGVLYARSVSLSSGALLATWENYSPEPPNVYMPIYRSWDNGATWSQIGTVQDAANNWGLRWEPHLYELPVAMGKWPAGTVLLSALSVPGDYKKTKIDVYASTNGGVSWTFASSVATGGEAISTSGHTPIWEPQLIMYKNQLVCYYSDQRDTKYSQKLVHQTTTDLVNWSAVTDDVHDAGNYEARPGMPAVARLGDGNYIFAYETCVSDACRIHYRMTTNALGFLGAPIYSVTTNAGVTPSSSPTVVWSSAGGVNGTIVLSAYSSDRVYINRAYGHPSAWREVATPQPNAYSRGLTLLKSDDRWLHIIGGGSSGATWNTVSNSLIDVSKL